MSDGEPQFERQAHGAFIVDGCEVAHTLQCPHCNAHFVSIRGSGAKRGWCYHCHAVVCGRPECMVHDPYEAKMERIEKVAIIAARG